MQAPWVPRLHAGMPSHWHHISAAIHNQVTGPIPRHETRTHLLATTVVRWVWPVTTPIAAWHKHLTVPIQFLSGIPLVPIVHVIWALHVLDVHKFVIPTLGLEALTVLIELVSCCTQHWKIVVVVHNS